MHGLSTSNAPSANLVILHYIFAALSFLVLCLLLLFSSEALVGHYFHPKLLAMTHIAALGWGSMIIFGALYQFLPVILETSLYSERLAKITFVFFAAGIICLVYSFWNFYVGIHIQIAAVLILLGFIFLGINIYSTARKASHLNIEADFIVTSSVWLLLTGILGVLMAFNFSYPFIKSHLLFLKIHAHMGTVGWFIMLIIGVASKLIPMFLLSHNLNGKKLSYAYYLVNIGLIGFVADSFFREERALLPLYTLITAAGILFFISFLYEAYKKRVKKQLDIGLKHSSTAILFLFLPLILGVIISFSSSENNKFMMQIYIIYGVSVFLGFISSLILGQTFKTLPFIVWLHSYKKNIGKYKGILPKDLYSEKLANSQYIIYITAMLLLITGIVLSQTFLIKSGSILLFITAFLYNINVFKILFFSIQIRKT